MKTNIFLTDDAGTRLFDATPSKDFAEQAEELDIDKHLFDPDNAGVETAEDLIEPLEDALKTKKKGRLHDWLAKYLKACQDNPDARLVVTRVAEPGDEKDADKEEKD